MNYGVIRGLIDAWYAWYVLEIKKNLISLGVMVRKGMYIIVVDLDRMATKCALVVMKHIRRRNLFYLAYVSFTWLGEE